MIRNIIWVVVCLAAFEARAAGEALFSVQSGQWSDSGTWSAGRVPGAGDTVTISTGHTVVFQVDSPTLAGATIETGAALTFDPGVSAALHSTGSVVVRGTLSMKPSSHSVVHLIAFVNVNEAAFVGGGMEVVPTDVGLWVRDGRLDLQGTPKTAWTRLAGGIGAATSTLTLEAPPVGWNAGDEISIVPTEAPSVGDPSWSGFDLGTVVNVSSATVVLNRATSRAHPMVNNQWRAEVLNLTRNVRIEGTGDGSANPSTNHRAHIWIRSDKPQTLNHVAIRHMGPRRVSDNATESILGRYALHFHHSMEGTRGSVVRGTVVRDAGAHAFASHMSHGIWLQDTISYNTFDEAYWWDAGAEPSPHMKPSASWKTGWRWRSSAKRSTRGRKRSSFIMGMAW
ncbi:G8 domain-containing protein [Myxococcus stipitatus]|uniref:G8 domain-containing protein n=1 Tax=Myxococcus stipitatus TaxID=83455 RepID=UPI001F1F3CF0|nr:G8 domain-containing protein [Myxococcus stipitatus]MCE9673996.1 G8 domain-containing protein [Myxococcus stipitatus]